MASISNIISTATSGLIAAQTAMSVTTTNITNAETVGYTKKTATISTTTVGGQATGVSVVGIGNSVDDELEEQIVEATSEASYDSVIASYYESLSDSLGTTDDGTALETAMTDLMTALSDAADEGASEESIDDVLEALDTWTDTLNDTSSTITAAIESVDESIADSIDEINSILQELEDINDQITLTNASGDSTADLEDSQREALEELASYIDINYYTTSSGEVRVYSSGGTALLMSTAVTLSCDISEDDGVQIYVNGDTDDDVSSTLSSGSLGALIELREETLPEVQEALDALAVGVADAINSVANQGSANPALDTLTSSLEGVLSTDAFDATGTLTITETNEDGEVISSLDYDLTNSTATDYATFLSDLNTQLAAAGSGVTASLSTDGEIVLTTSTTDAGVVVSSDDATLTADSSSLLDTWGFYDLISGTSAADMTVSDSATSTTVATAVVASTTVGETALASGDTEILQDIWAALDDAIDFEAGGIMSASSRSAVSQIAAFIDEIADRAEAASDTADSSDTTLSTLSDSFDNAYGVNVDEEAANLVVLQQSYEACAQVMSTAQDMFDSLLSMMN